MIINYPTGFYKTVLPRDSSDSISVTYTISNTIPPRTELFFPKIPSGIEQRQRQQSSEFDRDALGELVFSVTQSSQRVVENNSRLFDIGQVLEFEGSDQATLDPMFVSNCIEIQHNNKDFDYARFGLSSADVDVLKSTTTDKMVQLQDQLNDVRAARLDAEQIISSQQKLINDLNRNIKALSLLVDNITEADDDVVAVHSKLLVRRTQAIADKDAAVESANFNASESARIADELRIIATVVK